MPLPEPTRRGFGCRSCCSLSRHYWLIYIAYKGAKGFDGSSHPFMRCPPLSDCSFSMASLCNPLLGPCTLERPVLALVVETLSGLPTALPGSLEILAHHTSQSVSKEFTRGAENGMCVTLSCSQGLPLPSPHPEFTSGVGPVLHNRSPGDSKV